MGQGARSELPAFTELEKRVKALYASEKASLTEMDKLRRRLAKAEAEVETLRGRLREEEGRRVGLGQRLDGLLQRLGELPVLKEEG